MKLNSTSQFPIMVAYALAVTNALIIGLSFSFVKIAVTLAGPVLAIQPDSSQTSS